MNLESLWFRLYGDDSAGASVLRVNQLLELAKSTPAMAAGNIINSGLTASLYYYYTAAPLPLLTIWVALIWLLSAARLRSWWRNRLRPRPSAMSRRPLVRSTFWSALAGIVWGVMGLVLLQPDSLSLHVLVAFVLGGQAAAAAIWIAPLPVSGLAYILFSMIPVLAGFAIEGDPVHLAMAGMLTTYTVVLFLFLRNTHKNFVDAIRSGFARERMVVQLETAHAELEERVRQRTLELSGINRRLEREIAERGLADEELRKSRDQLRQITDNLPLLISYIDSEQRFVFANACMERWYGRPREEIVGRNANELLGQAAYGKLASKIESVLAGKRENFEEVVEYPDGNSRNVDLKYIPDVADDGTVRGYFAMAVDTTDRKKAEEELRASERLLQTIIDAVPLRISLKDKDGKRILANKNLREFWGLPEGAEMPGDAIYPHLSDADVPITMEYEQRVLEKGALIDFERERTLRDGRKEWIQASWLPLRSEENEVTGILVVTADITARKRAEEKLRTSERLLQAVFDVIPHWVVVKDTKSRYMMVNNSFAESYGLRPENFIGKHTSEMPTGTEEDLALFVDTDRQMLESGVGLDMMVYPATLPDGRKRISHSHKMPIKDEAGNIVGLVGVMEDVTERVAAEEKLRENEHMQQSVFDTIPVPVWFKDLQGKYKMVNQALCSLLNLPQDRVIGKSAVDLITLPKDNVPRIETKDQLALESRQIVSLIDHKLVLPSGDAVWHSIIRAPLIDRAGDVRGLVGVALDTTERVLAEQAVLRREEQLRAVIENIPAAVLFKDTQGKFVLINKVFEAWCQLPAAQIVGKTSEDLFDPEIAGEFVRQDDQVLEDQRIISGEYSLIYPDGVYRTVLVFKFPVTDESGKLIGTGAVTLDNTDRKQAEEELRSSEKRYHTLASSVPVGIFRTDAKGLCLYVNEQWCQITGLSEAEALGEGWVKSIHEEDREEVFEAWKAFVELGGTFSHEYRFPHPDGSVKTVLGQAVPEYGDSEQVTGYVGSITDITEGARLEEQLRQSQKMEAVGQLAGGVAHDFNNMLQIIISYVHLARTSLDTPENLSKYLDNISKGADRAANLTQQLLTFSRKNVLQVETLDTNELISNLMRMLGRLLGEDIEMKILAGEELNVISADAGMLERVLVNLCVNARDAMPRGGKLTIETSSFHANQEFCKIHGWQRPGDYILIKVSDTGEGMTADVREHIFEPFYTTKDPGKGTGLGLSMVYSIIEQHSGIVTVYSEPKVGTTFQLYLPTTEGKASGQIERHAEQTQGGTETILIAEDEDPLRDLLCELLEAQGYRVIVANDGEEAVSLYSSNRGLISLVIMDVVMPKLSGRTAYDQIRGMGSPVPVVFSTGYAANTVDRDFIEKNDLRVIHKPYAPALLFQTVREAIDGVAESSQPSFRSA